MLPPKASLRMQVVKAGGEKIKVQAVDLSARGAGFTTRPDVRFSESEVVEVLISSRSDGWSVRTPGVLRHAKLSNEAIGWGVEFINTGTLYDQLDDALGRHFNQRKSRRISPSLDRRILAQVLVQDEPISAAVHDLTVSGVGLVAHHGALSPDLAGQTLAVAFSLPRSKEVLSGTATVRRVHTADPLDLLGMEFDLADPQGFSRFEREIQAYCEVRSKAIAEWESAWRSAA